MHRLCSLLFFVVAVGGEKPDDGGGSIYGSNCGNIRRQYPASAIEQREIPKNPGQAGPDGLYFSFLDPNVEFKEFTQSEAEKMCDNMGFTLATLDTEDKDRFVQSLLYTFRIKHVWISGKKDNLSFKWRNGKTVGECYENWSRDGSLHIRQPDNAQGNEYCMAMLNNHFDNDGIVWHDVPCYEKKSFVCEPDTREIK